MTNREKSIAHSKAMAARSIKTDRAVIARLKALLVEQQDLLRRWILLFGDYCTTAPSGQLKQDTERLLNELE